MKVEDAHLVAALANTRDRLLFQRDHAKITGRIGDDTLDPIIITAIRPVIQAEIDRRLVVLDQELQALGVRTH